MNKNTDDYPAVEDLTVVEILITGLHNIVIILNKIILFVNNCANL